MYRFIYRRVGNREDAEDLTSQVFLKAVRGLEGDRDEASVRSWLFQLARTAIADYWRQYYRGAALPLQLVPEDTPFAADPPDLHPATDTVGKILAELPENYRRVLYLRFLEGCSIRETAARMGTTEGNVKVLQYRALRRAAELGGGLL
ncbi:MAG: sigma-70 family RNA polymerase sigma factor [Chloroflexi bacterium]|nr:sigma-70 family RNA polymerase sigma factor [Chloroflexota bacterium]